jgi:MtaA/CmuA family methyltransferase
MTGKQRLLGAIRGETVDGLPAIPITMMMAAAEIGVPYRVYAMDAEAHARGQIAISTKYGIDHVSGISDPAVEAADLGAVVVYRDDAPPSPDEEHALLADLRQLSSLKVPDPLSVPRMRKRIDVIARLKQEVGGEKAIEGWIEGPIAEAADLRGINRIMTDFFDEPLFIQDLIAFIYEVEMAFARAQIAVGADYIGIGDAAASLIGPRLYREFAWEAERKFIEEIHARGAPVRLHICGNITPLLTMLAEVKADIMDLDSMVSIAEARAALGPKQLIAGNINPVSVLKEGTPSGIQQALAECYSAAGGRAYAVAAGCEVPRGTPAANLMALTRFARG